MQVTLKHNTPLVNCSDAIRQCHNNLHLSDTERGITPSDIGPKDRALIDRVGNKMKHSSTLEHIVYTFDISGISRAVLQEFARHRIASPTVKSSRYTLKELNREKPFMTHVDRRQDIVGFDWDRIEKYIVMTPNEYVNECSARALEALRWLVSEGIPNDQVKYCMPESYKTSLTWTINARSLQNFLSLRSSKEALWEIRELSKKVFEALPKDDKYLFENNMLNLEDIHYNMAGS